MDEIYYLQTEVRKLRETLESIREYVDPAQMVDFLAPFAKGVSLMVDEGLIKPPTFAEQVAEAFSKHKPQNKKEKEKC
jgi:hypothetical protein